MKKLLLITLSLVMALTLCFGLTACDDKIVEQISNELGVLLEGGNFKEGSVLNLNDITAEKATEIIGKLEENGIAIDDATKTYVYDIFVSKDNAEVQPDGKVKVTVPMPADEKATGYNVYHMKDNGAVEVIPSTYKDGKVSFETDSFSWYCFTPTYNITFSTVVINYPLYIGSSHGWACSITCNGVKVNTELPLAPQAVPANDTVVLDAVSAEDSATFVGWYEAESFYLGNYDKPILKDTPVSTDAHYEFTMTAGTYALYAVFASGNDQLYIGNSNSDGGSVKVNGESIDDIYFYDPIEIGKTYSLTAEPKEGYVFGGWELSGAFIYDQVTDASFELKVMPGLQQVNAKFEPVVTGIVADIDDTIVYDPNLGTALPDFAKVKVSAISAEGTKKLGTNDYTVDLGGLDATKPGNYTVTYTYVKDTAIKHTVNVTVLAEAVTVTVENDGRGGTADHLGVNRIEKGSDLTLNAELYGDDFIFLGWYLEDGTLLSGEISYSFTANEDTVILARFKDKNVAAVKIVGIIDHMIDSNRVGIFLNGISIKQNKNEFYIGEVISLELRNAPAGYVFLGWYEKDVDHEINHDLPDDIAPVMKKTPLSTQRKFEYEITSDTVEIYAVLAHEGQQFILDASHSDAAIFKDKSGAELEFPLFENFKFGKTYTLTVEPKEGYEFIGWYIDEQYDHLVKNDTTLTYTTNLYSVAVHAEFKPVVTDLVVDMDDVTYYPDLLKQYTLIGIPEFIEICKEGKTGENRNTEYMVVGTIKSISNTTWGNMYIADGKGNELHLYGVYDENGTRYGLLNSKPRVGDTIAVHGTPYLYNNHPEMQKAYLLNEMPVLPDFENVTVSSVTADGTTKLSADEFTVDASAVNPDKPGEYAVVYTYKANPEIKATVTVKVIATPVCLNAWVNGGTILIDGVEIGPDYFEEFTDGFGKMTLTAKGYDNTVFKGWYTNDGNDQILVSTEETFTVEINEDSYYYAEYEYIASEIMLNCPVESPFHNEFGFVEIWLPLNDPDTNFDLTQIEVFYISEDGLYNYLDYAEGEYTIDAGGFDANNVLPGDYTVTFIYTRNPEVKATLPIRVLDEENMVSLDVSAEAGGRVTVDKPYQYYNKGTEMTVSVELRSEKDYEFLGWYRVVIAVTEEDCSETLVSTDRTYSFTLDDSMILVAKIEPKITRLEVEGLEENPMKIPLAKFEAYENLFAADRGGIYACGALGKRVELTADEYTVDLGGLDVENAAVGKYTVTYTYKADTSITYTVTVWVYDADYTFSADQDSPDNGWLLFEGTLTHAVEPYQYISGEEITITAAAKEGYMFLGWYLAIDHDTHVEYELITTDATYTFTIDKDTKIQAKFGAPVTEIDLGGANPITVYRGEFVDLSHIGVWSYSLIESRNLNTDEYTVDLGGLDVNAPVAGTYTITYTYKENPELTATLTVTVLKRSYYVEVTSDSGRFKYNGDETMHLFEKIEEGTTIVLEAVIPNPMYRTFLGWNKFDYETGEWKLYSTNKTLTLVVEESAEGEIRLRPVYGYVTRNLEMYVMGHNELYEAGVQHWNFDDMGYWDEELGRYIACGNIDLYADSEYATDIAKLFENFHIIAVDGNGGHRQISHEDLTIDLGDYKAEEGWYEIKVSYGSFTMTVNVMVLPAENA